MSRTAPPNEVPPHEWTSLVVDEESDGERVDRLLARSFSQIGRKLAAQLCAEGAVLLDGRRARKSDNARAGAHLEVLVSAWGAAQPAPHLPLTIVLERADLVIVDKLPGVSTGALIGKETNTVAGALIARYPEMESIGFAPREPGVIHRLDHETSGLLVAARTAEAFVKLREALSRGQIEKRYLALVEPNSLPNEGLIETPLIHDPRHRSRVRAAPEGSGQPARTTFRVVKRGRQADLVEARAATAFRHQVRAHFAQLGAPLIGDLTYEGKAGRLAPRHALHASYIACSAATVEPFAVESPLPADLAAILSGED